MKEQLVHWLTNLDYGAFFAMIAAFLAAYGGLLGGLLFFVIKTRLTKLNLEKTLAQFKIKLEQDQLERAEQHKQEIIQAISDVGREMITQNTLAQEKRLEVLNALEEDSKEAIQEVKKLSVDDVLEKLDKGK